MIRTEDFRRDGKQLHIIKEIKPKNGKLQEIHECLLGHICCLEDMDSTIGNSPVILAETSYDPGFMHHIRLSPLESIESEGDTITVTTWNTVYVFEPYGGVA